MGSLPVGWKVASAIPFVASSAGTTDSTGETPSYDVLADSPIEASRFEQFRINDVNPPVDVVIHGDNWSKRDVENALKKIVTYERN